MSDLGNVPFVLASVASWLLYPILPNESGLHRAQDNGRKHTSHVGEITRQLQPCAAVSSREERPLDSAFARKTLNPQRLCVLVARFEQRCPW
jgi:hypothetical protein